jgi:hypothetical protein
MLLELPGKSGWRLHDVVKWLTLNLKLLCWSKWLYGRRCKAIAVAWGRRSVCVIESTVAAIIRRLIVVGGIVNRHGRLSGRFLSCVRG